MKTLGSVFSLLAVLILFAPFSGKSFGQAWHDENGVPQEDSEWSVSDGDFGVLQLLTPDANQAYEDWQKPGEGYNVIVTNSATRGDIVSSIVLFTGCQPDNQGNCNLEVDFRVLDPNGGNYGQTGFVDLFKNLPAPPKGVLMIGKNTLAIRIEPDDPFGEYLVYATVRDLNSSKEVVTLQRLTVAEKSE